MADIDRMDTTVLGATNKRPTRKLPVPLVHLLASAGIIACIALLIFIVWFPVPLGELAGGVKLFWIIIGVDAVCGPFLTWLLFNPAKTRLALTVDISLVVAIQLAALGYGIHVLSLSRPVALVYEVDRFRMVSFSDIVESEKTKLPEWAHPWGFYDIRVMGTRTATGLEEKLDSVNGALQGVEPSQRPEWWQDYSLSVPSVLQRARPLAELRQKHPASQDVLDPAIKHALADARPGETTEASQLLWLPLVSRRAMDWVVLLDPSTGRPRSYAALDGF